MHDYDDVLLHIAGEWQPARSGSTIDVINPANESVIGRVSSAGPADLDEALAAVDTGFSAWSAVSPFERCKTMRRAADILREGAAVTARLLCLEQGKTLSEAMTETLGAADMIDWLAEEGRRSYGRAIPGRAPGVAQVAVKEPVGPVAVFTPWNFPINQIVRKVSAALAAGCSIIVKGAEETPASAARLIAAFVQAGVPAGTVNLVFGVPEEVSAYLIPHPVIRKISFTGSTAVGKKLAALAGLHMKRTTMELGGHAPVLVMEDADIDRAVAVMSAVKFRNAGQLCVAPTRFLVAEPVYAEFVEKFAGAARALKVGAGLSEGTTMGPLISGRRVEATEGLVQDAIQSGATLVTGGRRIANSGYFFEPTVLGQVPITARVMNEEPFGPIALMMPVGDIDEAIAEANRLSYGLAAYGFTRSSRLAATMMNRVRAGMISINHQGLGLPEVPFGGMNDSGHGTEGGADALEAYLNTKFVSHAQMA